MCLAIPGKIKKIEGRKAMIEYRFKIQESRVRSSDEKDKENVEARGAMVGEEGVKVGDWVMVQMGIVVKKLNDQEAKEMLVGWKS